MARLILLDRDGVVNADSADYIKSAEEFAPLPGAIEAMVSLTRAGIPLGLCTNQSGIARGLFSESDLAAMFSKLERLLAEQGGRLDGIAYCPHLPEDDCQCRKPRPGMLISLMQKLGAEPGETTFVGDSVKDIRAAQAAGCHPVLVRTGNGRSSEDQARILGVTDVYDDLAGFAANWLLQNRAQQQASSQQ